MQLLGNYRRSVDRFSFGKWMPIRYVGRTKSEIPGAEPKRMVGLDGQPLMHDIAISWRFVIRESFASLFLEEVS